jgi:hypothetical protein
LKTLLASGLGAGALSLAAVAASAVVEGQPAVRPLNATSHWLWGDPAGKVRAVDIRHTAVALATHQASAFWWAGVFAAMLSPRPSAGEIAGKAALTAGIAAVVDYGLIHRRLTPGWELAVSSAGIRSAFAGLALGLALGALATNRPRRRHR